MCEINTTGFFRPWNVDSSVEQSMDVSEKADKAENNERISVVEQEDSRSFSPFSSCDETSVTSSSEHEVSSLLSSELRLRGRSTSSGSANSEDATEGSSIDLLSNFAFGSSSATAFPGPSVLQNGSLAFGQFPVAASCLDYNRMYSTNYLQGLSVPQVATIESPNVPIPLETSTISTTRQPYYYNFPNTQHFSQGSYVPMMEKAVEMLHRQDAVAKQMKKLRPKKFRCEHCDVAFSNNGQLKGHIRIHTGERPFKCDTEGCGKSFTRNEELTRHKRIHTGLRPHSCVICGKRFGRKDHLKKHMRTHENRDPYRMSTAALGMFALGHTLPQGHSFSHIFPM